MNLCTESRRKFLAVIAGGSLVALAGCADDDDSANESDDGGPAGYGSEESGDAETDEGAGSNSPDDQPQRDSLNSRSRRRP